MSNMSNTQHIPQPCQSSIKIYDILGDLNIKNESLLIYMDGILLTMSDLKKV
jgi:hypothetical protein